MAVVPPLNNFMGPEGDTVTVAEQLLNTEYGGARSYSVPPPRHPRLCHVVWASVMAAYYR